MCLSIVEDTIHFGYIGYRGIKIELSKKCPPCWLVFIVPKAAGGENSPPVS